MFETLDKMILAGVGAMSMSREKAEKIFDEYVAHGKAAKETKSGFVKELMDSAEKTRADMEKMIGTQIQKALDNMNLPTKTDIERLEAKIAALQEQVEKSQGK
jgi:poly(hydroxyalkanoate) granule-associated protein